MGAHAFSSSVSDPITIHNVNIEVHYDDDIQSFKTPQENNFSSSSYVDTMTTTTSQNLSKPPPPGK